MSDYSIRVETHPMADPKPISLVVFDSSNRAVAFLTIDEVRQAVRRWDLLEAERLQCSAGERTSG